MEEWNSSMPSETPVAAKNATYTPQSDVAGLAGKGSNGAIAATPEAIAALRRDATPQMPRSFTEMIERDKRDRLNKQADAMIEKRRKREATFAALGDGISALANVYFASKGAPDMLKGAKNMTAAQQERWDKVDEQRRQREREYQNQYYRLMQLGAARDRAAETNRLATEKAKRDDEYRRWKAEQDDKYRRDVLGVKSSNDEANRKERERHNKAVEGNQHERNQVSASKGSGGKGRSGSKSSAVWNEQASWAERYPDEYEAWQKANGKKTVNNKGETKISAMTETNAKQFNAEMRKKHGSQGSRGSSGTGSGTQGSVRKRANRNFTK